MGKDIQYFMWRYQPHYQVLLEGTARRVLQAIDERFSPEVFLVGVLQEQQSHRYPACVEPESECWVESEAFNGVFELAAKFQDKYVEAELRQSHPLAQQWQDEGLHRRAVRDAILNIIEHHSERPEDLSFFASFPEMVEGYLVCAVLAVQTDVLSSHHRLASGAVDLHPYRQIHVVRSLIDAAIYELLSEAAELLCRPDPGLDLSSRPTEDTIRAAARRLAGDTAFRVQSGAGVSYGFYEVCEEISCMKYEKSDTSGKLVLAGKDHKYLRPLIAFADTVSLRDYRRARKLLELASGGYALHTNADRIFGLVDPDVKSDSDECVFEVRFLGHHHWELRHAGRLLMGTRFGKPYLPRLIGYESKVRQDLPRLFPTIPADAAEALVLLVRQGERERHGTLLVISGDAAAESARLGNQATPIEPCLLTPELLRHLTGIDGAVMLDPTGYCHAVGVILDGLGNLPWQSSARRPLQFSSPIRGIRKGAQHNDSRRRGIRGRRDRFHTKSCAAN